MRGIFKEGNITKSAFLRRSDFDIISVLAIDWEQEETILRAEGFINEFAITGEELDFNFGEVDDFVSSGTRIWVRMARKLMGEVFTWKRVRRNH